MRNNIELEIDGANKTVYVTKGGKRIARFNDHKKAEAYALLEMGVSEE
jgi:hypothetical protein